MQHYRIEVIPADPKAAMDVLNRIADEGWEVLHCHPMQVVLSVLQNQTAPGLYVLFKRGRRGVSAPQDLLTQRAGVG